MQRIVVDTNVLVSALRSRSGASFKLVSLLGDPRWQPIISVALVLEYEEVARREAGRLGLADWVVDGIVDMFCRRSLLRQLYRNSPLPPSIGGAAEREQTWNASGRHSTRFPTPNPSLTTASSRRSAPLPRSPALLEYLRQRAHPLPVRRRLRR